MKDYLKMHASQAAYETWLGSSDFITPNVSAITGTSSVLYKPKVQEHDWSKDYFTMVARETGTIGFKGINSNKLSYSIDGGESWTEMTEQTVYVNVNAGDKVLWKGTCTPNKYNGIGGFTNGTATFDVEGNVMSLIFGDNFKGQISLVDKEGTFISLFGANTKVISAKNLSLPATTLVNNCYGGMFSGCTSLIEAPVLPATTLASSCYSNMFYNCTSLTTAPELPATTLDEYCYENMFVGCTSLTTAPELPATILADSCYTFMFNGCTSLTTASELPATILADSCYKSMFNGCTSLTTVPSVLPATTLAIGCYKSMFNDCTSLETAPELPATTLAETCYLMIFNSCTKLNYIKCLATDISASYCTSGWVNGIASSGTFTKSASADWSSKTGNDGIPSGWTVQDAA